MVVQTEIDRLLRHFYDLPFIGMAMTSPASKHWLRFNDRLCEILGYTREELATKTWAEITHPDDLNIDVAEFERVMRGETEGYAMDKRFLRPDGAIVHASIDVKAVRHADRTVDYFVATVQDMTERTLTQRTLARQKDLYRMLSETNQAIVRTTGRDELLPTICRIAVDHGHASSAWIGLIDKDRQQLTPVAHFGDEAGYAQPVGIAPGASDPDAGGPVVRVLRSGEYVVVNDLCAEAGAPWHDAAFRAGVRSIAAFPLRECNAVVGAVVFAAREAGRFTDDLLPTLEEMAIDVSFAFDNIRRQAEMARLANELRESAQQFRFLADSGQALIWTSGTDKLCNYFNRPWLDFTGRTLEQETGNGWTEGVHPDDFQHCLDIYTACFDRREAFSMEYRLRRHDGEYRWLLDEGTPRFNSSGEFLGYIGHCLDIDERKKAESRLSEQVAELRRWHEATLGREMRLLELKREVNALLGESGRAPRYASAESEHLPEQ